MSGRLPLGKAFLMLAGVTALGYGIMYAVTPTEEQFYNSLAPDLQRKVDERRRLLAKERGQPLPADYEKLRRLQEASAETPVWQKDPPK